MNYKVQNSTKKYNYEAKMVSIIVMISVPTLTDTLPSILK